MPAVSVRETEGSDAGRFGVVACLGGSLFRRPVWAGSQDLAAVSGLSGASLQALLRHSDQGFGDGRHTPLDNR